MNRRKARRNSLILIAVGILCCIASLIAVGLFLIVLGVVLRPKKEKMVIQQPERAEEIVSNSFLQMQIDGHLRVIDDCVNLLEKTVNIETFFSRYDLLIERIRMLEEDTAAFPESKINFDESIKMIQDDHEEDISRFIQRAYDRAVERGEKLTGFFGQFEKYKDRLYYSNASLLMELCRKSGLSNNPCYQEVIDLSHYVTSRRDIERFRSVGFQKYTFHCLLDIETCPICGNMDGKSFNLDDAEAGINLPPLHSGCRCFVGPYRDDGALARTTRAAQTFPNTWKKIPRNINWVQWRDMFSVDDWSKKESPDTESEP